MRVTYYSESSQKGYPAEYECVIIDEKDLPPLAKRALKEIGGDVRDLFHKWHHWNFMGMNIWWWVGPVSMYNKMRVNE